jgi:O-acetylserine/cysteine efflux transporter
MNFAAMAAGMLAVILWAAIPAFVKTGNEQMDLSVLLAIRFLIASIVMLPLLPATLRQAKRIPLWRWLTLLFTLGANYYFQGLAMSAVPVSWYGVIFSLNPILTLIFMRVPMGTRMIVPLGLALLGTYLILSGSASEAQVLTPLAASSLCIGMATWVLYTIQIIPLQRVYSDLETTALTQFVSLIAVSTIWVLMGLPTAGLGLETLTSVSILGLTTPLAYFAFCYCLRRMPVFGVVSQYLEPVVGIAIGLLFFEESFSTAQWIGSAAIIMGMTRLPTSS